MNLFGTRVYEGAHFNVGDTFKIKKTPYKVKGQ